MGTYRSGKAFHNEDESDDEEIDKSQKKNQKVKHIVNGVTKIRITPHGVQKLRLS